MTTFARTSNVSAMCSHRAPMICPSSRRSPTALVLIRISAPAFAASFPAPYRRPDLGAFLDEEDIGASAGGVLRGRTAGRSGSDDQHIDLSFHPHLRIPSGLIRLLAGLERVGGGEPGTIDSSPVNWMIRAERVFAGYRIYDVLIYCARHILITWS